MTPRRRPGTAPLHLAILRSAAWLVPGPQRAEWLAEWRAELWYVKQHPAVFCLGAFRDALWLRRNSSTPNVHHTFGLESPSRCILLLAFLAAVSMFFAFRLPLARDILLPSPYRDPANLVMISAEGRFGGETPRETPTVPIEQYRSLANRAQHRFTGLAFYRPMQTRVQTAELSVGLASGNLFDLLQIPIPLAAPGTGGGLLERQRFKSSPVLILSHAAWRKYFQADPQIVGRVVEVAGHTAVIAGVIPESSWRLPGRMDAWLLQDQAHLAALPPHTKGFVIGHLRPSADRTQPDPRWRLSVPNEQGNYDRFECWSLARGPVVLAYVLNILLAFLLLTMTTPLALGEYPANRHSPPGPRRLRRWIFLAIKIALLLAIVCCGSLDLASITSMSFQPHGLLISLILALRWALMDQRQRCPVCLRLLSHPTRIGCPSHTFLEWYGTELICAQGHGLLYVPEIPTSCYGSQRWQYLDPSWGSLFS
jgi:hypothetical protein